jgi:hypothetical protein
MNDQMNFRSLSPNLREDLTTSDKLEYKNQQSTVLPEQKNAIKYEENSKRKETIQKPLVKRAKKEPPSIPCYTLRVNETHFNKESKMASLIGYYIHYPICKTYNIDEVRKSNIYKHQN